MRGRIALALIPVLFLFACPAHPPTPSTDASLSGLTSPEGSLYPAFSKDVLEYEVVCPTVSSTFRIAPVCADASASLSLNGSALASGASSAAMAAGSTATILVTAQDGTTTRTYRVRNVPSLVAHWPLKRDMNDVGPNHFNASWGGRPTGASMAKVPEYVTEGGRTGIHFQYTANGIPPVASPATDPPTFIGAGDYVNAEPDGRPFAPLLREGDYVSASFWIYLDQEPAGYIGTYFDGSGAVPYTHDSDSSHMNILNKAVWYQSGWQIRYNYDNGDGQNTDADGDGFSDRDDDDTLSLLLHTTGNMYQEIICTHFRRDHLKAWTHVVVTMDNTGATCTVKGYVNGVKTMDTTMHTFDPVPYDFQDSQVAPEPHHDVGHLSIGAYSHTWGGLSVTGKMSDVRIYHSILSDDQASFLHSFDKDF